MDDYHQSMEENAACDFVVSPWKKYVFGASGYDSCFISCGCLSVAWRLNNLGKYCLGHSPYYNKSLVVPRKQVACIRFHCQHASSRGSHSTDNVIRQAQIQRKTSETQVFTKVVLDGQGKAEIDTGIPFLDHMLSQICSHGLLDLHIKATGDLHIDDHHTNEDIGITFGLALLKALGEKRGIQRFGHFIAPLDEALVQVVLDFSGRPFLHYGLNIPTQRVGTFDTQLVREFYSAVANSGQFTLHIRQLEGINSHHIIEVREMKTCH